MWGIFYKETDNLDHDPEPMVFKKRDTALMALQSGYGYVGIQDDYYIRELTEEEEDEYKEWLL